MTEDNSHQPAAKASSSSRRSSGGDSSWEALAAAEVAAIEEALAKWPAGVHRLEDELRELQEVRRNLEDRLQVAASLPTEPQVEKAAAAPEPEVAVSDPAELELESQLKAARALKDELRRSLFQTRNELQAAVARAEAAEARAAALEHSALFRAASYYRRAVEKTAPAGTYRRQLYQSSRQAAGNLVSRRSTVGPAPQGAVSPITLSPSAEPDVTIVIPVHGKWAYTAECLRSIARQPNFYGYQVVVVDDASPDDTAERLDEVEGIEVVSLAQNRGFVGAVNAGIERVLGRYVILLNNDTIVQPNWLDALVDLAESDPAIGVAGSKLIYPDGRLQEAGGIIFQDASGWNYGRGDDPMDPAYSFVRQVDYCSGAALLVRTEFLRARGGLDERFAPAYYEDTDLCFAAREVGYKVVFQPESVVVHAEGISHGTDLSTGGKSSQARNQSVFSAKWSERLAEQYPPDASLVRLASRRPRAPRAIVMDYQIPTPDQDSGSRRMFELLQLLTEAGLAVTFIPEVRPPQHEPYAAVLQRLGLEVRRGPEDLESVLEGLAPELALVVLARPIVAEAHMATVRRLAPAAKVVYDTVDLHFLRERRRAEVEKSAEARQQAELHYETEMRLAAEADATLVVSPVEQELLLGEDPSLRVRVLPNIHADQHAGLPYAERKGLLFVGSFPHPPNRDAARWLVEEILPLVHQALPGVPVNIVGSQPTEEIMGLSRDNVTVLGWVPDLTHLYRSSRVFVAPLRYGAGMKGKVGESLSYGLPVVTTRIGAEGMGLEDGNDVLIADDAAGFAEAVVRLYESRELWSSVAAAGRRTIAERYSPGAVRPIVGQLLEELGLGAGVTVSG